MQSIMNKKLSVLTQEQIQEAINAESITHSPKSVRNMHGLLSAVLKAYRLDFGLNTVLPKRIRPQIYVPTDNEVKTLMKEIANTQMEIPILLAAFGLMRRGEICALDSTNIQNNNIHVNKNMVKDEHKKWVVKSPKSYARDRMIEFPDFLITKLGDREGRIVELSPSQVSDRFVDVLKRAGIQHFRFHDLRHYHASISHALGIPDQYIMTRGGWASDTVLKNVYRHTMADKMSKLTDMVNDHFKSMLN